MHPRGLNPGGTGKWGRTTRPAGACLPCRPPALPLACFPAPIPPPPFPSGEGGVPKFISPGARPRRPGIKPPAALTEPAKRVPCAWEPAVRRKTERTAFPWAVPAAKERGTGGDGTIRRKRRRRLRRSSPPGQGEQVPLGFSPPPGTAAVRLAGDQPGKSPAGFMFEKVCKCRRRLNAGDARGGAPCMK